MPAPLLPSSVQTGTKHANTTNCLPCILPAKRAATAIAISSTLLAEKLLWPNTASVLSSASIPSTALATALRKSWEAPHRHAVGAFGCLGTELIRCRNAARHVPMLLLPANPQQETEHDRAIVCHGTAPNGTGRDWTGQNGPDETGQMEQVRTE